jgi:RNA polymerase sigma-70 factor (ECF subfamily)
VSAPFDLVLTGSAGLPSDFASVSDPDALRRLLLAMAPAVRRLCRGVLGTEHPELEDAVQEALSAIAEALPQYRHECPLQFYALRIAWHRSLTLKRRGRKQRQVFVGMSDYRESADEAASPLQNASAVELRAALDAALGKLPDEQAEALVLRVVLGFSIAEIASICEVSVNTIKTRLRLGKEALRRRLKTEPILRTWGRAS